MDPDFRGYFSYLRLDHDGLCFLFASISNCSSFGLCFKLQRLQKHFTLHPRKPQERGPQLSLQTNELFWIHILWNKLCIEDGLRAPFKYASLDAGRYLKSF